MDLDQIKYQMKLEDDETSKLQLEMEKLENLSNNIKFLSTYGLNAKIV